MLNVTVDVPVVSPVRLMTIVTVPASLLAYAVALNSTRFVGTGVGVGVGAGVGVGVGVGVGAGVGVGVGPPTHENTSENARTVPVSAVTLSLTLRVQVPAAFCPSNADTALFGENVPDGNAADELDPHWVSTAGKPPSSSSVKAARLLLLHPEPVAGTPGRSKNVTFVPAGELKVNFRSPTQEWLTPTVVEFASALGVPSNRKLRSVIVQALPTTTGILTPAATLSGMATAGPVKLTVVPGPGVGVGLGTGVGEGVAVGVTIGVGVGVGTPAQSVQTRGVMISEKRLNEPESTPAVSLTFNVHVPFGFCPSNAESGLSGAKFPLKNCPVVLLTVERDGKPPSSSSSVVHMFSRVPPRESKIVTVVPPGDLSLKIKSPMNV